ncbi:hypothetical protein RJ639_019125 [Escallonia herrerae]|uniref:Subtilisin-like protease n=1 Tax=Escallonia herrerae TaxID=1293975 RepID=A0AA88V744_9ASTE|nr:hypothetical protein RJ639_019125 [Escallonia herrerae]
MNSSTRIIPASRAHGGYFTPYQSSYCLESSLNRTKVRGKVLVCRHVESSTESKLAKSVVVKEAGGVGMVLVDETDRDVAIPFVIPAAMVGRKMGDMILSYIHQTREPMSRILSSKTILGSQPAPRVASFSSKGPNSLTPSILKEYAATVLDKQHKPITVDPEGGRANAFDYGSGYVNPTRVLNPGLIYDAPPADYKAFLCSIGYDEKSLHLITRDNSTCQDQTFSTASGLNYPSITVPNLMNNISVTRTLENVGAPRSIYRAVVSAPRGINVMVVPRKLNFTEYGQKINFTLTFRVTAPIQGYVFGFMSWKSRTSQVTTPLVIRAASSKLGLLI